MTQPYPYPSETYLGVRHSNTKDAAQRSIRTFYEVVINGYLDLSADIGMPHHFCSQLFRASSMLTFLYPHQLKPR